MIKRLKAECLACLTKKYMTKYPQDSTEEQQIEYMRGMCQEIANASEELAAPVVVRNINDIHEKVFGSRIDYAAIKPYYNNLMLSQEERIQEDIDSDEDSLKVAIQYALVGNYIDFGAMANIDEELLFKQLNNARDKEVDEANFKKLVQDLEKAKTLAILTDNCGEIVLDKLLVKTIKRLYPQIDITVVVRGGRVLNDAAMEDAKMIGLDKIVKVIGNGNNIAGTWEPELSDEARKLLNSADVILAKGQANFETLNQSKLNIYYIFLCKCEMFARNFNVERFSSILLH